MKTITGILLFASLAAATEPNFTKSTIYKVGKVGTEDKNIVSTSYSDGLGRQLQAKVKLSNTKDRVVCTFFDAAGRPDSVTKPFFDEVKEGEYLVTTMEDLIGATGVLRTLYTDAKPFSYTKYSDDPLSRVIEQNGPGAAFAGNAVKIWYFGVEGPNTDGGSTDPFDANGFIKDGKLSESDLTGSIPTYLGGLTAGSCKYFLTVTKDGSGRFSQELRDLFSKTKSTWSDPTPATNDEIVPGYEYDILGNLIEEHPPSALSAVDPTYYIYNSIGQLVKKQTPDGGFSGYKYSETGQLLFDTSYTLDVNGTRFINRIRGYFYDELDRLTEVKVHTDGGYVTVRRNYYDGIAELTAGQAKIYRMPQKELASLENLTGRLVASVAVNSIDGSKSYVSDLFSYDEEGRVKRKTRVTPGLPDQFTSFTYDLHGKVLTEIMVCGTDTVSKIYHFDAEGRLDTIKHIEGNKIVATYLYDELSRLDKKQLGIGASTYDISYLYNIREGIRSIAPTVLTSKWFAETNITYSATGNITSAKYEFGGLPSASPPPRSTYELSYTYDKVNRLTGVTDPVSTDYDATYKYDPVGRLERKKEGTNDKDGYLYYSNNNRLRNTDSSGATDYLYDSRGNMLVDKKKKLVIEYDCFDMPVSFKFYDSIPPSIGAFASGSYAISGGGGVYNLYKYMDIQTATPGSGVTFLSRVVMLYDASGNRVYKMEGK